MYTDDSTRTLDKPQELNRIKSCVCLSVWEDLFSQNIAVINTIRRLVHPRHYGEIIGKAQERRGRYCHVQAMKIKKIQVMTSLDICLTAIGSL